MVASGVPVQLLYALIVSVLIHLPNAIAINRSHWSSPSVRVWLDGIVTGDILLSPAQRLFSWESTASFCGYFLSLHIFPLFGMLCSILLSAGMTGQLCSLFVVLSMMLLLLLQLTSPIFDDIQKLHQFRSRKVKSTLDGYWMDEECSRNSVSVGF